MAITQENIAGGKVKIGGTTYSLVEIVHGGTGTVIWPAAFTYVLEDVTIHYSSSNQILASAANYAWVTATVKKYRGSTLVETTTNVTVTPTLAGGQHFYVSGNYIYGYDLGTTSAPNGYNDTVTVTYLSATASAGTVYQQLNRIESTDVTNVSITVTPKQGGVVVDTIDFNAQTVDFYGSIVRTLLHTWTSNSTSSGVDTNGTMRVYLNGGSSYVDVISNGEYYSWSIPENTTLSDVDYTLRLAYSADTSYYDEETITQEAGVVTYGNPEIYSYGCDDIAAAGGTEAFWGLARQPYYINGASTPSGYEYPSVSWSVPSYTAPSLGTNETSARTLIGSSTGTCTAHGKSASPVTAYCYQEINEKFYEGQTVGEKQYGTPYIGQTYYQNPAITSFVSDLYSSSASPCSAAGGNAQLTATGTVERQYQMITPWSQTTTEHYSFTSNATLDVPTTVTDHDVSYTSWETISETPEITGGDTGFNLDATDNSVLIDGRANVEGAARSAGFTATLRSATASLTLYQEANVAYPQYEPIHSLDIQHTGDFPASGGSYSVNYVARQETWTEYTSGYETQHTISAETIAVDGFYCTPRVNSISGTGTFIIDVEQNRSGIDREVTVTAGDASDSRTQEA